MGDLDLIQGHFCMSESEMTSGNSAIVEVIQENLVEVNQENEPVSSGSSGKWPDAAVRLLLTLYADAKADFGNPKIRKKVIWEKFTKKLAECGHHYTSVQVSTKWKTLVAAYKRVLENNGRSGRGRQTCAYEEELRNIVGGDPNIKPRVVMGNLQLPNLSEASGSSAAASPSTGSKRSDGEETTVDNGSDASPSPRARPPAKKRRDAGTKADRFLQHLQEVEARREQRHQERLELAREMHHERMEALRALVGGQHGVVAREANEQENAANRDE